MKRNRLLLTICGLLTTWVILPADSLQIDYADQSPEGFMQRLRQFEEGKPDCVLAEFNEEFHKHKDKIQKQLTDAFMHRLGSGDYSEYLCRLAASKKLSDQQKLESPWLPLFGDIFKDSKKMQVYQLRKILNAVQGEPLTYPLLRLLLVMTFSSGVSFPLREIFKRNDMSLAKKLLSLGVDPHYGGESFYNYGGDIFPTRREGSFFCCISVAQAELLLEHGADVQKQNLENGGLILHTIYSYVCKEKAAFIRFFLSHLDPNEDRLDEYWFNELAQSVETFKSDDLRKTIQALVRRNCLYDEKAIKEALESKSNQFYSSQTERDRGIAASESFLTWIKECEEEKQATQLSIKGEQEVIENPTG